MKLRQSTLRCCCLPFLGFPGTQISHADSLLREHVPEHGILLRLILVLIEAQVDAVSKASLQTRKKACAEIIQAQRRLCTRRQQHLQLRFHTLVVLLLKVLPLLQQVLVCFLVELHFTIDRLRVTQSFVLQVKR